MLAKMMGCGCHLWTTAVVVLLVAPTWLEAQVMRLPAEVPRSEGYPGRMVSHADSSTELLRSLSELAADENPDRPLDARDGMFQKLIFDATWLSSGRANGFGMVDLELESVLALPVPSRRWPMTITPGFAVHYLDGPTVSDLPPEVYDATVQFRWWRRFTPRFGVDFSVTPGVCSDFEQSTDEALRIPGHVTGMFEWTPRARILFGVAYLDREDVGVLPVGGLLLYPNDDLKLELAVPRPRVARRIHWPGAWTDDVQDWVYVAGEFGGGTWAIRRADLSNDVFTYRDYRLILGLERKAIGRLDARLELGYVFSREIQYTSGTPDVEPSDTLMVRSGLRY